VGLWSFIGSECLFFATLISTYVVYKARNPGPPGAEILEIPLTSFSTFILLMSSVLMVLALNAIQRDDQLWNRIWLIGCAFFGMIFLGVEIHEFHGFWLKGMAYQTNLFSQCFYTLVGTHGTHVAIGILWICVLIVASFTGKLDKSRALSVEMAGLYWHFVDIVWVIIFTLVYLMQQVKGA
jgi:heme/copper-type cytochrome/quinol oxidase subunit 3